MWLGGSLPSMDEDNNYMLSLSQQQLENISVSDILKKDYEHNGFLYKRAQEKITDPLTEYIGATLLTKWQLRYVILYHEYVLYFKNERCTKPKGVFSLRGYNRVVRAEDMTSAKQEWAFKIIGLRSDDRTWYFGAASEREMRLWMAYFKVTMEKAIHGKARDKSLRILKDLQYNERKFVDNEGDIPRSPSASNFEPGIYEDIEEEVDYLPPKANLSVHRQMQMELPRPPAQASVLRGPLPAIPPRQEPIRRGLGSRTQSDPTPPPQKRDRTISFVSTPKVRHRSSAPTSPGSRPKFPEPSFMMKLQQSALSTTSTASEDYVQPPEADENQIQEFRFQHTMESSHPHPSSPVKIPPRRTPKQLPEIPSKSTQRQGPEGNSFRHKFVEGPAVTSEIKEVRAGLKPALPVKPKPDIIKPKPPAKPQTPLKPVPAVRSPQTPKEPEMWQPTPREPAMREPPRLPFARQPAMPSVLPDSCLFDSSDKREAEGMLYDHSIDGMYLLRNSGGNHGKVLMVYHGSLNLCKHYKVFRNERNDYSLTTEPVFSTMEQLVQHYLNSPLPNTTVQLSQPYPG